MINIVFKIVVYLLLYMTTVNLRIDNCVLQQGREFFLLSFKTCFLLLCAVKSTQYKFLQHTRCYCFVLLNQHSTSFYNIRGATAVLLNQHCTSFYNI